MRNDTQRKRKQAGKEMEAKYFTYSQICVLIRNFYV